MIKGIKEVKNMKSAYFGNKLVYKKKLYLKKIMNREVKGNFEYHRFSYNFDPEKEYEVLVEADESFYMLYINSISTDNYNDRIIDSSSGEDYPSHIRWIKLKWVSVQTTDVFSLSFNTFDANRVVYITVTEL